MPHVLTKSKTVRTSKSDLDLFFDLSLDMMVLTKLDGEVSRFNNAWLTMLGYTRTQLNEKNPWKTIHNDDMAKSIAAFESLISGEKHLANFECRHLTIRGNIVYISWNATIDIENGLIYSMGRDVTNTHKETVELQQSEEKFKFLSENSLEGMCITYNGTILTANKEYLNIFGFDAEAEVLGKNFLDLIGDASLEKVKSIVSNGDEDPYQCFIKRKNGSLGSVDVRVRNILYLGQHCRIAVLKDLEETQKAQQKLHVSEERFRAVFESTSFGMMLIDLQGNIIEANSRITDHLGYSHTSFIGKKLTEIILADDQSSIIEYFKILVTGKTQKTSLERRFIKKDKSITWLKVSHSIIHISIKEKAVLAILEDLDDHKKNQKALNESQEKFRAVYESSPMGILITKKPGIILDVNPAFSDMLGYPREELIGTNILNYTHISDAAKTEKWLDKLYSGEVNNYTFEKRYITSNGAGTWVKAHVSIMNVPGEETMTVAIIENIDKKRKTEQSLELKNKELLHTNQELEHFAYVASHDLQEPLRTITSFIQILNKRYNDKLDKDGQQFMSFVVEGAKRMQNLIHDLLEYSRINRFNSSYEKIDLNEVYTTVNRVLKDKIESNDAVVLSEHLPTVYGSKHQLTQIFQNMVDNAIKFRGKHTPEVIISVIDHSDKWELIFKDNGIGISREYYQRIFVIFQRLHTHEEYTGTGIGLAICKKIIERHGGDIWVDSKPGKGSAFHMTLAKNLMAPIH